MNQPRDRYGRFLPAQDIIQEVNTLWKLATLSLPLLPLDPSQVFSSPGEIL